MPKRSPEWYVIGRGFNGWHAEGINVSSSGGNLKPYEYFTGQKCAGYLQEAFEGALVYDARHLEQAGESAEAFIKLVIQGPMVDPKLPPDGVDRFCDPGEGREFSAFDRVSVATYERLLKTVPGIKIGHVQKGKVVWE